MRTLAPQKRPSFRQGNLKINLGELMQSANACTFKLANDTGNIAIDLSVPTSGLALVQDRPKLK